MCRGCYSGVCGSALEFMNDESSPSCIETPAIPFSQKFTVSMWVKLRKSHDAFCVGSGLANPKLSPSRHAGPLALDAWRALGRRTGLCERTILNRR